MVIVCTWSFNNIALGLFSSIDASFFNFTVRVYLTIALFSKVKEGKNDSSVLNRNGIE